ncbi:unnamed protein product [Owenia fusiformis]|uniref:Protein ILRUN n=1 Tax=Owenia fusiformis TaxID=6347 RepID=A0A8J1UW53_OWEFU|nr:unnamed protein product [Owenia fusiformis]
MDVDSDFDSNLLQQFSSMGTQDKDVLIAEFQKLLGNQLNPAGCAFFLDMNNWNLQAAICSYYEYEQPTADKLPQMTFVKDITIGEGESVPPRTAFTKTWRIMNSGDEAWPPGCSLKFLCGDQFGHRDRAMANALQPGAVMDISVDMSSPANAGMFQGQWRMTTATGMFFGDIIWVILQVEEGGVLGLTQQLSHIGSEEFNTHSPQKPENPFGSPATRDISNLSPVISPNYSLLAQHGSPTASPHQISFTSTPVRTALFQDSINNRQSNDSQMTSFSLNNSTDQNHIDTSNHGNTSNQDMDMQS